MIQIYVWARDVWLCKYAFKVYNKDKSLVKKKQQDIDSCLIIVFFLCLEFPCLLEHGRHLAPLADGAGVRDHVAQEPGHPALDRCPEVVVLVVQVLKS